MALKLYDTQRKEKLLFAPLEQNKIGIYVCGVTVYDLCHIGHARTFVCFDLIVRYLKHLGYQTRFVRNITDIDDKIIARASALQCSCAALTQEMTQQMHDDFRALNLLEPDVEPRATAHIAEMIECIATLLEQEAAYLTAGGDVYFKRSACKDYGILSGQNIEELIQEHRIEAQSKIEAGDFVLWKQVSDANQIRWDSPWGPGRPGWHIECSAMSKKWLGETFDIHGGGGDLKFPHHENERAQSICCNNAPLANYWMHTGMVQIMDQKMSKSLNNFLTIRELLNQEHPEVLRYFLLMAHYRSPLQYHRDNLQLARQGLLRLYTALDEAEKHRSELAPLEKVPQSPQGALFEEAMQDDFNLPRALSALFDLARKIFIAVQNQEFSFANRLSQELRLLGSVLGILSHRSSEIFQHKACAADPQAVEKIEALVNRRDLARASKAWQEADALRQELLHAHGVLVEDHPTHTSWRYQSS